jgi:hypothetical protein
LDAARCLIPGTGQPDPTAKHAHKCLEKAAFEFNRVLLSARFPDYANSMVRVSDDDERGQQH